MFITILVSVVVLLVVGGLSFFVFSERGLTCNSVFSQDEVDYVPYIIPKFEKNSGLKAVVKCSPNRTFSHKRLEYDGMTDCRLFIETYGTEEYCQWGCPGYGTCVSYCPQDAIIIKNDTAIITESCNGCGLCLDHCPQNLIDLVPRNKDYFIQCAAPISSTTQCSAGCTHCGNCSGLGSLTLENAENCPRHCIKKLSKPYEKRNSFIKMIDTMEQNTMEQKQ